MAPVKMICIKAGTNPDLKLVEGQIYTTDLEVKMSDGSSTIEPKPMWKIQELNAWRYTFRFRILSGKELAALGISNIVNSLITTKK